METYGGCAGEGYELEAVRRLGYRIASKPDKVTANEIQLGLQTKRIGRTVYFEETVESTQHIAAKLAYEGAEEGTVVVAEEQTAGRGRLSRKWHSPKGTGIWMSIILRPSIPVHHAPQLTLLAAVGVAQAIEKCTGVNVGIKWPNDILIQGKKAVGILTEMQAILIKLMLSLWASVLMRIKSKNILMKKFSTLLLH